MRALILIPVLLLIGACSIFPSSEATAPVGIGTGVHELKRSPCACMPLPNGFPLGTEIILNHPA